MLALRKTKPGKWLESYRGLSREGMCVARDLNKEREAELQITGHS